MGNSSRLFASIERLLNLAGKSRRRKRRMTKLNKVAQRALAIQSLEHRWLMSAEGVGELVELQTQVLDSSGFVMQPEVVDGVPEYLIGTGEKFSVRTRARDLRPNAQGVFAVYTDLSYATLGNPSAELAQLQWSEVLQLKTPKNANGGSFTLTTGSETTQEIQFTPNLSQVRSQIKTAVGALSFVGGENNIQVQLYSEYNSSTLIFSVIYVGQLARRDVPNLVVGSNSLTSSGTPISLEAVSSSDVSDRNVVGASMSNPPNQIGTDLFLSYNGTYNVLPNGTVIGGFQEGTLNFSPTTGNRILSLGNFTNTLSPEFADPGQFVNIVDTAFKAANAPGIVEFKTEKSSNEPRLPILLFGSETYAKQNEIDFPDPFRIRIVERNFQNPVSRFDVNADGSISPIDSLHIVSRLANEGLHRLVQNNVVSPPFVDVDGDFIVSPIDALQVLNEINRGGIRALEAEVPVSATSSAEGVGELAQVDIQILSANGDVRSPRIDGRVPEYIFVTGEKFSIRTRARDLRSPNATGVFSTYTDIQLLNQDGSNDELLKVLWGESQTIKFPRGIHGGSFSLSLGTDVTSPIDFTADINELRTRIENAIGALPSLGGPQNIRVNVLGLNSAQDPDFDRYVRISFIGDQSRKDIPDAVVVNNILTSSTGGSTTLQVSPTTDLANRNVLGAAMSYPINLDETQQTVRYNGGAHEASIESIQGGYRLNDVGGFAAVTSAPLLHGEYTNIVDTAFQASTNPGIVIVRITPTGRKLLGVAVFGLDTPVTETFVEYPSPFVIRIVDRIEAKNDQATVIEDSPSLLLDPLINDTLGTVGNVFIRSVTQPSNGGVLVAIESSKLRYTPRAHFAGTTSFTYTISDTFGITSTATISIEVTPVNDPPIANAFATTVLEDSESNFNSVVILAGDLPGPPDAFDERQNQSLSIIEVDRTTSKGGIITPTFSNTNAILSLNYKPAADFGGTDVFTYTLSDNFGTSPLTTKVTIAIHVEAVNDAPIFLRGGNVSVQEDSPAYFEPWVVMEDSNFPRPILAGPLTALDEIDGSQTVRFEVSSTNETLFAELPAIDAAGSLRFKPAQDANGIAVVSVTAIDSGSSGGPNVNRSETVTFTITIQPVNDAPTASNDGDFIVASNATTNLSVLSNDNDVDGPIDVASVEIIQAASKGVTTRLPNGQISYRANVGSRGTDSFTYRVADSTGSMSNEATVSITINPAPIAVADSKTYLVGDTIEIQILANDTDEDGNATIDRGSITIVTPPAVGNLTILQDGNLRYSPPTGFKGTATFEYTITDDRSAASDPGLVTLQIVDSFHQNPRNQYDVDDDGDVAPLDVLQVINALKRIGTRDLGRDEHLPRPYIDVDGSRSLEPLDVLQVINYLKRRTINPTSEGEAVPSIEAGREEQKLDGLLLADVSDYAASIRKRNALTDAVFAEEYHRFGDGRPNK